jgi:hypothetical protein
MTSRLLLATLIGMVFATVGLPQAPAIVRAPAQPVKLRFVLSREEGGRKISYPYTLSLATGITSQLRIGSEVPTSTTLPNGQTRMTVQQVGVQIDALVNPTVDGRFAVMFTVTAKPLLPDGRLGQFVLPKTVSVREDETSEFTVTDGGETLNVAVTLVVVK